MGDDIELREIGKRPQGAQAPKLHVVFVHGLGGDAQSTWKSKQGYWPQWVADEHPLAQVWVASYPAAIGHLLEGASSQPDTQDIAKALSECLWSKLQATGEKTPIIFVCHSLGGLVVKRILVNSFLKSNKSDQFDHQAVKALIFLGTPHKGSGIANVLTWFAKGKKLAARYLPRLFGANPFAAAIVEFAAEKFLEPENLIHELESGNNALHQLASHFSSFYTARRNTGQALYVKVFAEGKALGFGPVKKLVVDQESANPDLIGEGGHQVDLMPLSGEDHFSICKPDNKDKQVNNSLNSLISLVLRKEAVFGLATPLRNAMAILIHQQLVQYPEILNLPAWKNFEDRTAWSISQNLANAENDQIKIYIIELAEGFKNKFDDEALFTIAGALINLLLWSDTEDQNFLFENADEISISSSVIPRYESLAIEAWHAILRNWPLRVELSDSMLIPKTLTFVNGQESVNGWTNEDHLQNIAWQLANENITFAFGRIQPKFPLEQLKEKIISNFGNQTEFLFLEAKEAIERLRLNKRGVLLDARDGVFAVKSFQEEIRKRFDNSVVRIIQQKKAGSDPELYAAFQAMKGFLEIAQTHLKDDPK